MLNQLALLIFKSPQLLWLLGLILIPIIVHLFNLRRTKKIIFSNTALLKKVQKESSAKRKPRELLILFSRICAIILLVLAFAQPIIKEANTYSEGNDSVVIYLDNSPSLLAQEDGFSLIDKAINMAQAIVETYPEGTQFQFIENSYSNSFESRFTRNSLTDRLTEAQTVGVGRTPDEIEARIKASGADAKEIYWISDFQNVQPSWGFDSLMNYHLIPVANEMASNIYVDSVYLENAFLSGSFTNLLRIQLRSIGLENRETSARVYLGNKLTGSLNITLENGFGTGQFELPDKVDGLDQISLTIDDPSTTFDNEFYLSVNAIKQTNVLEVASEASSEFISKLFEGNEFFRFTKTEVNQLNGQAFELADFIIVNGLNDYSNQLRNALALAKDRGATIVIIPGSTLSTNQLIDLGPRIVSDVGERLSLQSPDFSDPFYAGVFEDKDPNMQMPSATTSFRLLNVEYNLLTFLNGRPFLSKVATNANVYVFASPFETETTNFVNHALFVPIFYRLALGSKRNFANLYYYTDSETITYPIQASTGSQIFNLENTTTSITPDQRENAGQLIMYIPKDEIYEGNYALRASDLKLGNLAFNLPRTESEINPNREQLLADFAQLENVVVRDGKTVDSFRNNLSAQLVGKTLWRTALLLGLLFLFVEIILIRYL